MRITLLVDLQEHDTLSGEFGLSFLLETANGDFLFDTGADTALKNNLALLNIPPAKTARVILSHGHYDHTGGLAHLAVQEIYCCCDITQSHYSYHGKDDIHNIAMPAAAQQVLKSAQFITLMNSLKSLPAYILPAPYRGAVLKIAAADFSMIQPAPFRTVYPMSRRC